MKSGKAIVDSDGHDGERGTQDEERRERIPVVSVAD